MRPLYAKNSEVGSLTKQDGAAGLGRYLHACKHSSACLQSGQTAILPCIYQSCYLCAVINKSKHRIRSPNGQPSEGKSACLATTELAKMLVWANGSVDALPMVHGLSCEKLFQGVHRCTRVWSSFHVSMRVLCQQCWCQLCCQC